MVILLRATRIFFKPVTICMVLVLFFQTRPLGATVANANAQENCRLFQETGKSICGIVLEYWEQHGGLAQHGYPFSDAADEVSYGQRHRMQYFERSVLEIGSGPNNIAAVPLASMRYARKYSKVLPRQLKDAEGDLNGIDAQGVLRLFASYWKSHGGLRNKAIRLPSWFLRRAILMAETT
jgi:hypothetical protein